MTWFRLDDNWHTNPKILRCSPNARLLYIVGLSHASNNLTDGHLEEAVIPLLHFYAGSTQEHIDELVEQGLWKHFDDGYGIKDYLEYQTSKAEVERRRGRDAQRKRRARRDSKGESAEESHADVQADNANVQTDGEPESANHIHMTSHDMTPGLKDQLSPKKANGLSTDTRADHSNTKPMTAERVSELGVVLPDLPTDEQVKSLPELRKRRGSAA